MQSARPVHRYAGFSLIEVLVAVVVLSFGLLALASLQGSLFKTSAETKAQSVALGLATEKLEYFRGYSSYADYLTNIVSGSDAAATVGGVTYTRTWTVNRYAYPAAGGNFALLASNTAALTSTYATNNEFKRILVNVTWTDAQNNSQRVSLEDAIGAVDPGDSRKIGKLISGALPRGPEVRIYDPSQQQEGVIPIAIGGDTSCSGGACAAATNPKPLVNGANVIETRFDVMTYSGVSGNTATAQSRVETSIAACSCDYGNAPSDTTIRGKRPTYWNGYRYTLPESATYAPPAGVLASATNQSALCTVCCRDHHDPASLATGEAKFDPRNTAHPAGHSLLNASTAALGTQALTGTYTEACRIIRVGGLFRVAADTYDDYMNLLSTKNDSSTTAYLPTTTATTNYQNFVISYLTARDVTPSASSSYNNVLPITSPSTVTNLETSNSINQQTAIVYRQNDPAKWLHLRGLYIDWLEDPALQAVSDAKANCLGTSGAAPTAAQLQICVLKVLPFTSINLTELGDWSPLSGTQIVVAKNNFVDTLSSTAPVRGKVTLGSAPTNGQTTNAVAKMRRSNSGLTTLIGGIDTDDAATTAPSTWTATQPFTIQGGSSGGGGSFTVDLTGYPFALNAVKPYINDVPSATCNPAATGNPYTCTTSSMGVAQTLTLGKYNYATKLTSGGLTLNCTDVSSGATVAHTFGANGQGIQSINVCSNFSLSSTDHGGSIGLPTPSDGAMAETTSIAYPIVNNLDAIHISVTQQPDTRSYVCTLSGSATNDAKYSVSPASCP